MNKGALFVVALFTVMSMGIGALVGAELGAVGPTASPTTGVTATPATADGGGGEVPAATTSSTPTATPTAIPTVAPDEFDRATIEREIRSAINAERQSRGLQPLDHAGEVRQMNRFHSEQMADQRYVSYVAGGFTVDERRERFGLSGHCRVTNDANTAILDGREVETVGRTVAGRPYTREGDRHVDRDESAVASAVADQWLNDDEARAKLLLANADAVGVGAVVAGDGAVYVTVTLC